MAVYDPEETAKLENQATASPAEKPSQDDTETEGGFYKPEKRRGGGIRGMAKGMAKKKGLMAGIGGGGIGIVVVVASMFSHLAMFQADGLLKGIDSKTQRRMSATLDTRNKYLMRSYIKARMLDTDNDKSGNNTVFFSADKVDDKNPLKKWYKTMRNSNFEKDLLENDGIKFVSMRTPDGKFKSAQVLVKDTGIPPDILKKYDGVLGKSLTDIDNSTLTQLLTKVDDADLGYFVEVKSFGSQKEGRQAIKAAVESNTNSFQVFKRRHLRKDLQSVSGVKSWRLFENQRDKIAQKKLDVKENLMKRMVDKYFSNSPGSANMMKCLFSDGSCSTNTDPASADSQGGLTEPGTIDTETADDASKVDVQDGSVDQNGNPLSVDGSATEKGISADITDATQEVLTTEAKDANKGLSSKAAAKMETATIKQKIMYALIAKITKKSISDVAEAAVRIEDPSKIWFWSVRLSKIDGMINNAGKASKLIKMVLSAKRSQVVGLYATYQIAASQMHSGQLTGEEASAFMETINGFGNSEGWDAVNGNFSGGTAAAATTNGNLDKQAYCAQDSSDRKADQYAWLCDDQRPNSGGNAQKLSDSYSNSLGKVIGPIAGVVRGINGSVAGKALNWANNLAGSLIGKLTAPIIDPIMKNTGLGKSITAVMSKGMLKLMDFLGAGPMFDGSEPGNVTANLLTVGSAESAEISTRDSGGIASTPQSLAYSTQLADQFAADEKSQQSLYERYASLSNINSLASTALMSFHPTDSIKGMFSNIGGLFTSFPRYMGDILTGKMFVHADTSGAEVAKWAGVQTYDIPEVCVTLDPADPNYLDKATNADFISNNPSLKGSALGYDTMRDGQAFWKAVYAVIGSDNEVAAGKIYDCAILDARVEGSIGAPYGYTDDNGLSSTGGSFSNGAPTTTPGTPSTDSSVTP